MKYNARVLLFLNGPKVLWWDIMFYDIIWCGMLWWNGIWDEMWWNVMKNSVIWCDVVLCALALLFLNGPDVVCCNIMCCDVLLKYNINNDINKIKISDVIMMIINIKNKTYDNNINNNVNNNYKNNIQRTCFFFFIFTVLQVIIVDSSFPPTW